MLKLWKRCLRKLSENPRLNLIIEPAATINEWLRASLAKLLVRTYTALVDSATPYVAVDGAREFRQGSSILTLLFAVSYFSSQKEVSVFMTPDGGHS